MHTRTTPLLGIESRMYRHFAALTLVMSLSIAMFADGSNRKAVSHEIEKRNRSAELKRQEQERFGPVPLVDNRGTQGAFGSEAMDIAGMAEDGAAEMPMHLSFRPAPAIVEYDRAQLDRMTPQQRATYIRAMEEEKRKRDAAGPYQPTAAEIDMLRAASAARSGSSGDD